MGKITKAFAICNNEVALIAWDVDDMIPGCVGFDITRIDADTNERKRLATWVPFEGQRNPDWLPQDTGVWPVQKTFWRDLTLRRRRDQATLRPDRQTVRYAIQPLGKLTAGGSPLGDLPAPTYTGNPIPLTHIGEARETNTITVTSDYGDVSAAFTNGILSGQWLKQAMKKAAKEFSVGGITREINDPASDIRGYLTGDVLGFLKKLVQRAHDEDGRVHLALYELADPELMDFLFANKDRIELILSNTSAGRTSKIWDEENKPVRSRYHRGGVIIQDRLFNNRHIGHNKFAVYSDADGVPRAVLLGSTNWTATGLCGQSNNAMIVQNDTVAKGYLDYWKRLHDDAIPAPSPAGSAGGAENVQGPELRDENRTPVTAKLNGGAPITLWCSPNTKEKTRNIKKVPPDLKELFDCIAKARQAVFFLAFLPSRAGLYSTIGAAVEAGQKKSDLLVVGAISDPTAMPNYKAKTDADGEEGDETPEEKVARSPYVYDTGHTHIVRAASLTSDDAVGDFEAEILKVGVAIVHDKIVVIDPMSDDCVVATGSHNMGYKASYENDENMVIIRGNKALAQAYATHVYDVYDHYRFRAWQAQNKAEHKPNFQGNIQADDKWLKAYVSGPKGDIAAYLMGNALPAVAAGKTGRKPVAKKKKAPVKAKKAARKKTPAKKKAKKAKRPARKRG